jgi:Uma2 family endonuclease
MQKLSAYITPPRTLMEVYRMLPEGTRAEIINGTLYMSPAPTLSHQDIIINLGSQLYIFTKGNKLGKACNSPVDVYLDKKNAFQPDLVFVSRENSSILKEDGIYGAPDLVIEVLSPGNKTFDLTKKKKAYEKAGAKEYWVVDPETRIATGFQLKKEGYKEFKSEKGKLNSALLNHVFKF